ncbi:MAG: FlgB family protein [Pseudomonadota bacterium]
MLEKLTLVKKASAMARHAAARHRILSENVANADTPGYRARDVKPFSATVNEAFTARATRSGHLLGREASAATVEVVETDAVSPNGNSVSLEQQSVRAVETQGSHALAMAVYSKAVDILRIGLGRAR